MTAQGGDILAWLDNAIFRLELIAGLARDYPAANLPARGPWAQLIELHGGPSPVLRRCAADRKELARHTPTEWPTQAPAVCPSCAHWNYDTAMGDDAASPVPFPCPSVLSLAEGYGWTEGER